jgi:hypothetical protein
MEIVRVVAPTAMAPTDVEVRMGRAMAKMARVVTVVWKGVDPRVVVRKDVALVAAAPLEAPKSSSSVSIRTKMERSPLTKRRRTAANVLSG